MGAQNRDAQAIAASAESLPGDEVGSIEIVSSDTVHQGFRRVVDMRFRYQGHAAEHVSETLSREVADIGKVAAVLPYDPERDALVLLRQFRIGGHMATGRGRMIEIVAGLVDPGETLASTARRETEEEAGVRVLALEEALTFIPSPGFSTECATLFCARVDAGAVPAVAGHAGETEFIEPFVVAADEAIAALDQGRLANAYIVIALSWFARHRGRLREQWLGDTR